MNVDYINPFVQGAQNILNAVSGETANLGSLFLKKSPYASESVAILIGIFGGIEGNIIYTMNHSDACAIASKMMMGMPVAELDDISKSALSELANMISGNVATLFSGKGKVVDITTPQLKLSPNAEDFSFISPEHKVICIPLTLGSNTVFEIDLCIAEAATG